MEEKKLEVADLETHQAAVTIAFNCYRIQDLEDYKMAQVAFMSPNLLQSATFIIPKQSLRNVVQSSSQYFTRLEETAEDGKLPSLEHEAWDKNPQYFVDPPEGKEDSFAS